MFERAALLPTAVFSDAVFAEREAEPRAVLSSPATMLSNEPWPTAVFLLPVAVNRARPPTAVFWVDVTASLNA